MRVGPRRLSMRGEEKGAKETGDNAWRVGERGEREQM